MAVRLNKEQTERVRSMIQTDHLIKRLQDYAVGKLSDKDVTPTRMKAIEILLRKSLPDLSAIQLSGDELSPLTIQTIERAIVDPKTTDS